MQEMKYEELVEIWKLQDRSRWREEVFPIVEKLLVERLGYLPEVNVDIQYDRLLDSAESLAQSCNSGLAIDECEKAILLMPDEAEGYYLRGLIHEKDGKLDEALNDFRLSVHKDFACKEYHESLINLTNDLRLDFDFEYSELKLELDHARDLTLEDDIDEATRVLELLSKDFPASANAWNYRGMIHEGMEQLEKAIECYLEAVRLNPLFWNARENLGNARKKLHEEMYGREPMEMILEETGESILIGDFGDVRLLGGLYVEDPLPGWFYLKEVAYFIKGTPGYRTCPGRSGYDPLALDFEEARMEGILIKKLFTGKLRTHNPVYLLLILLSGLMGMLPIGGIIIENTSIDFNQKINLLIISSPSWVFGIACLFNTLNSLVSKKPVRERSNGSAFF